MQLARGESNSSCTLNIGERASMYNITCKCPILAGRRRHALPRSMHIVFHKNSEPL